METSIPIAIIVAIVYLLGLWTGYNRGKNEVLRAWKEWMDEFLKEKGDK